MKRFNINEPGSDVPSTPERDALRRQVIKAESAWRKMRFIPVEEKKLIGDYEGFSLIARTFTGGGGFPEEQCLLWNNSNESDTLAPDEKSLNNEIERFLREKRIEKRLIIAGLLSLAGFTALVVGKLQPEYQQSLRNQPVQRIKERSPDDVYSGIIANMIKSRESQDKNFEFQGLTPEEAEQFGVKVRSDGHVIEWRTKGGTGIAVIGMPGKKAIIRRTEKGVEIAVMDIDTATGRQESVHIIEIDVEGESTYRRDPPFESATDR